MTSIADPIAGTPRGDSKASHAKTDAAAVSAPAITLPVAGERELRLDLFRGMALWLIFVDHLPTNILTWFTIRNYGFSDATEIFIFISGYTAAFVYGRAMLEAGFVVATARILRRVWQIYVAHVFLFTIFLAEISYVATRFENPLYSEEMGIMDFLKQPDVTIIQALLLRFRPVNMDVLPLYIVLMLFLPLILWLMKWRADVTLALSVLLYALTWHFDWYLTAYPSGFWIFNPFCWQLLFVFGAWCALGGAARMSRILSSPITLWICAAYLLFAFFVTLTWHLPQLSFLMPKRLEQWMYPITKTDLDVLRFAHFLALAALTVRFLPRDWSGLKSPWLRPLILCGQHSLEIFCLGVFLAFAGHFVLAEVSGGALMHALVSVFGILIMWGMAWLISWYKHSADKMRRKPKPPAATPTWREGAYEAPFWSCAGPDAGSPALAVAGFARAEDAQTCEVPAYLLTTDSTLSKVADAIKNARPLNVLVVGSRSSTILSSEASAYPAKLQAALKERLPSIPVNLSVELQSGKTAEDVAAGLVKLVEAKKPTLVIWQTGTVDAMRSVDPDDFRGAVDEGVVALQNAGADVVMVNLQYSPRTETMISAPPYLDNMRVVAQQHDVPLFDRFAIMRHWNEAGDFDLFSNVAWH